MEKSTAEQQNKQDWPAGAQLLADMQQAYPAVQGLIVIPVVPASTVDTGRIPGAVLFGFNDQPDTLITIRVATAAMNLWKQMQERGEQELMALDKAVAGKVETLFQLNKHAAAFGEILNKEKPDGGHVTTEREK